MAASVMSNSCCECVSFTWSNVQPCLVHSGWNRKLHLNPCALMHEDFRLPVDVELVALLNEHVARACSNDSHGPLGAIANVETTLATYATRTYVDSKVSAPDFDILQPSGNAVVKSIGIYANRWATEYCTTVAATALDAPTALSYRPSICCLFDGASARDSSGNGNALALALVRQSGTALVMGASTSLASATLVRTGGALFDTRTYVVAFWVYVPASAIDGSNAFLNSDMRQNGASFVCNSSGTSMANTTLSMSPAISLDQTTCTLLFWLYHK
ncbi:hypothetical protein T492DRAFT_896654 [Pavlovales sp. CCMP2436]|nr:hypothetical protein T492DRAFT_896654 [Pavlovales sp. CCMP2436]